MADQPERSAEEREAARVERERRRAQRHGVPELDPADEYTVSDRRRAVDRGQPITNGHHPSDDGAGEPPEPGERGTAPRDAPEPTPAAASPRPAESQLAGDDALTGEPELADEPELTDEHELADDPELTDEHELADDPELTDEHELADDPELTDEHELGYGRGEDFTDEHELAAAQPPDAADQADRPAAAEAPHEVPMGTRRVARFHRSDRARESRRLPSIAGLEEPPRARRHSWLRRGLSLVALLIAAALIWFLVELFQPFHGSGQGAVTVSVPAHSSTSEVGDLLERDGVISSSFFFQIRATLAGDHGKLLSGTYHLKHGMSYGEVLKALTTPPPNVPTTNVTIVPGETRAKLSKLLNKQGIKGSYLVDTRHSSTLNPRTYGAPPSTPSLEGFLYPDTYQLRKPVRIPALVTDQLNNFKKKWSSVNLSYARTKHLSPYDVLIVASMIEGEAEVARDRPLIASVIYNRLRLGMPLQIDATTRYATGNFTKPLTESQLNSSSPYNTRNHQGLPPTPISNPGMASIQAAAHPAPTGYLYFVVKPCGNGEHAFATNYAQFQNEVRQYQTARARRGGNSPSKC